MGTILLAPWCLWWFRKTYPISLGWVLCFRKISWMVEVVVLVTMCGGGRGLCPVLVLPSLFGTCYPNVVGFGHIPLWLVVGLLFMGIPLGYWLPLVEDNALSKEEGDCYQCFGLFLVLIGRLLFSFLLFFLSGYLGRR